MIERRFLRAFGTGVYYALCHKCRCWVKSSTGQYGWGARAQRDRNVQRHNRVHHAAA